MEKLEKLDLDKLIIHISKPRKTVEETQEQVLRSIAILSYCIDKRLEQLNLAPSYEPVFKKKTQRQGQTVSVIIEWGKALLEPASKVAEDLSKQFPQHCSPAEWRARAGMFQHVSVKDLRDIRDGMLDSIRGFKHTEALTEVNKAFDYLEKNHPRETMRSLKETSEHWLKAMLRLREAKFSYYASKEASAMYCFMMDKDDVIPYGYFVDSSLEHTNLPSTWENAELQGWRLLEAKETREKEQLDAEYEENRKQRKNAEPMLVKLIGQGMSDAQIQRTLEAQKKPRLLIRDLMGDVRFLRHQGVERHKPVKVEVMYSVSPKPTEKPPLLECPPNQHWSDKLGMCVEGPAVMFQAEADLTKGDPKWKLPECPEGQVWNHELGKCMPIKPPEPQEEKKPFLKTATIIHMEKDTTKHYPSDQK